MNSTITKILRHPATIPVAVGVISFGGGVVAGFFYGRKVAQDDATQKVVALGQAYDEALAEKGAGPLKLVIDEDHPSLTEPAPKREMTAQEYLAKRVQDGIEAGTLVETPAEPAVVASNVFAMDDGDWDYEAEKRNRDSSAPYVLHKDEFFAREMGLTQKTLIYYEGDNTLVTDEEPPQVLYNIGQVIGELKFGHGSGEEHVFYVRNESRREEYEVVKEEGSFEIARKGFEPHSDDIEHSVVRRFRPQE